jgi:hypothetical protein
MSNVADIGVSVTRSLVGSSTNIYAYSVTFPSIMGDVPQMIVHPSQLTPAGVANAAANTFTEGNVISGTFTLEFEGEITTPLPYDASEDEVIDALQALPM